MCLTCRTPWTAEAADSGRRGRTPCGDRVTKGFRGRLWQLGRETLETAELIVSELAGNAAMHGRCQVTLGLTLEDDGQLGLTVVDHSGPRAGVATELPDEEHGRGMHIVRALARHVRVAQHRNSSRIVVVLAGSEDERATPVPLPHHDTSGHCWPDAPVSVHWPAVRRR
jgi:anti-sigma regulatory factor (Ser/Thr protein kinase)